VHRILERFFKKLRAAGRFEGLDTYTSTDYQQVEDIARECFADLERRGVTGHPLVWENTAATIRADLRTFLARDERWRRERRAHPRFFEQPFGMRGSENAWPLVEIDIAGHRVGFRGSIDRVDLDRLGRRAYLYDYKTGSNTAFRSLNEDAVMAGKHVQLMLYRRAVLASLPDVEEVHGFFWFITGRGEFKMLPEHPSPDADRRLTHRSRLTGSRSLRVGSSHRVTWSPTRGVWAAT